MIWKEKWRNTRTNIDRCWQRPTKNSTWKSQFLINETYFYNIFYILDFRPQSLLYYCIFTTHFAYISIKLKVIRICVVFSLLIENVPFSASSFFVFLVLQTVRLILAVVIFATFWNFFMIFLDQKTSVMQRCAPFWRCMSLLERKPAYNINMYFFIFWGMPHAYFALRQTKNATFQAFFVKYLTGSTDL